MRLCANVIVNNLQLEGVYDRKKVESYIKEKLAWELAKVILESDIEITCKNIKELDAKEYRIEIEVL